MTNNPSKCLKQHNGVLAGAAKKTSSKCAPCLHMVECEKSNSRVMHIRTRHSEKQTVYIPRSGSYGHGILRSLCLGFLTECATGVRIHASLYPAGGELATESA
jgi:hypothetical protein